MIWIFGDSFASSNQENSWVRSIGSTKNFASNGSSEHRIFKNYLEQQPNIQQSDLILFVHTSPSRIFLKDNTPILSRTLHSHTKCDIIINDVYEKKEREYIKLLETIWDEEYFVDTFNLIVDRLVKVPNSYHITFFESIRDDIYNLNYIWTKHRGDINHMNKDGNRIIAELVNQLMH